MIVSKRACALWDQLYSGVSIEDQFNMRFVSKRATLRPDGDGIKRRETPCGAVLVIANNNFIVDVYPIGKRQ